MESSESTLERILSEFEMLSSLSSDWFKKSKEIRERLEEVKKVWSL